MAHASLQHHTVKLSFSTRGSPTSFTWSIARVIQRNRSNRICIVGIKGERDVM